MSLDLPYRGDGSGSGTLCELPPTVIPHKTTIEAIGGIDGEAFFREFFANDFSDFDDKVVVDFGAGFGDTLDVLASKGNARRLLAVDPIYESQQLIDKARSYTLSVIADFQEDVKGFIRRTGRDNGGASHVERAFIQQSHIESFSEQNPEILRMPYLPQVGLDRVIIMSTLYAIPNFQRWLSDLDGMLKPDGVIYVVDFCDGRGNNIHRKFSQAGIDMSTTYARYFFATLKKGDAQRPRW